MATEAGNGRKLTPTQARAARRDRKNRRSRMKRTLIFGAVVGVSSLFLVALFIPNNLGNSNSAGPIPDGPGVRQDDQGRTHIEIGDSHGAYNTIPATSGWHYAVSAAWGIKDEPLPPETYIHNMEHGGVILHYNCPDGCEDEVNQMADIVRRTDETILMPNPDMESRFAVSAWNWLATMDVYDDDLARDFVRSHLNSANSPEPLAR